MKITITGAAPHPQGLQLGLRVEGPKKSWLRFNTTVLVVEALDARQRGHLLKALDRCADSLYDDDRDRKSVV